MADRQRYIRSISRVALALANTIAVEKGELACFDVTANVLTKGADANANLIPIGYFLESGTGDGTTLFGVELFDEIRLHFWDNDGTTPVAATDLLSSCYIKDDRTVSGDGTGRSAAGRVWVIDAVNGVGVEMVGFSAG